MFAFVVVAIGTLVSFLVPDKPALADDRPLRAVEGFEPLEPMDPDPTLLHSAAFLAGFLTVSRLILSRAPILGAHARNATAPDGSKPP